VEFHTSNFDPSTTRKLLHAKKQDGRPAFNLLDLRRLSMTFCPGGRVNDEGNIHFLLQNAKLLENFQLKLYSDCDTRTLAGILSLSPCTLKVLDLRISIYRRDCFLLCEALETLAGHSKLECLSLVVEVESTEKEGLVGSIFQEVEKVFVKPGWSALRQVSFEVSIWNRPGGNVAKLCEALQSLPDKYLSHLPKLESVAFNYSVYNVNPKNLFSNIYTTMAT
jgi:hypothetical protein